jgi:hypothetical protein
MHMDHDTAADTCMQVLVSFRGTEPTAKEEKFADVFVDVDIWQIPMDIHENPKLGAWQKWFNSSRLSFIKRRNPLVCFWSAFGAFQNPTLRRRSPSTCIKEVHQFAFARL